MRLKNLLINLSLLFITLIICLAAGEFAYRKILFSKNEKFKSLRKPELYADYFNDDDYWKLYHIFGGEYGAPKEPHPLLGWIGDFDRKTLRHNKADSVKNKRPVLLFGDSFAQCVDEAECFQSILNSDSAFSKNNYFLNYGVGGYGVDQIQLLCKEAHKQYEKPFVVFSIMCSDLDRTILTNRIGQKPYYEIVDDSLVLKGVPIESDPEKFFSGHPPQILSYLYKRVVFTPRNPLPDNIKSWLKRDAVKNDYKMKLNDKVLQLAMDELRRERIDFVFLVFHYVQKDNYQFSVEYEDNWRDKFLRGFIDKNKLPYIWSKDLIKKDPAYHKDNLDDYMIVSNGHPTTYFNRLISNEIKKAVLASEKGN